MNLVHQGESSGGPSVQPEKRRRGRPRKDPSLKHSGAAAHLPSPSQGVRAYHLPPQRPNISVGTESMVGQAVTGVVEATFDSGYLLNVRIGHSNTNLRGVVFKPGHFVPITADNDVAPHVQMIRRNDVHYTQGWSHGQNLAMQTAAVVPSKRKYAPRKTAHSVPPEGARSSVGPVVSSPNGFQTPDNGDKEEVHMVEPISVLPPNQSVLIGQVPVGPEPHLGNQVAPGIDQDDDGSFDEGDEDGQEKTKTMMSTDIDTSGSSESSGVKVEGGKEALKSSGEDSGIVSKQETGNANEPFATESLQAASVTTPLFNYGAGRMTELLQALQENVKENQVQIAQQPTSETQADFHETMTKETDPKIEASGQ